MTDPRSPRPEEPSDDAVEVRLRRTLATVADREPVTPQLDDLRARIGDATDSVGGAPMRSVDGERTGRLVVGGLIAAAVLLVVAAGVVAVARERAEERMGPMAHDLTLGSGWYLPGAGTGWEVVGIAGVPWAPMRGVRREVGFSSPDRTSALQVSEYRLAEGARDPLASLEEVERGSGATARTYGLVPNGGGAPNVVLARRGDLVLSVQGRDVDETVLRLVDGWWESEGERIDPVPGMVRTSDLSSDDGRRGHTRVIVTVRRGSDGVQLSYALTPSDATLLPTGIDDEDLGAARGLEEGVRPRPIKGVADQPGPAWEVGPDSEPGSTSVVSRAGADILIADDISFAPPVPGSAPGDPGSDEEQVIRRRAHIELLSALRPVDPAEWADAVAEVGADPALATSTLFDVPTGDIGPGTTTTALGPIDDPPTTSSTTTAPTTSTSRYTVQGLDPQAMEVAEALIAFARDPNDETFAAVWFLDPTTLAVFREDGSLASGAFFGDDRSSAALRDPVAWELPLDDGRISALLLIADQREVSVTSVDLGLSGCGFPDLPEPGPTNVAIVPSGATSCADRFAVVLNGDSGRISEVAVVLPSP